MPDIDLIPEVYHQANDPYNFYYDNLPLTSILERQKLINFQVDTNSQILRESIGTEGTLANRLDRSLNPNGSIKVSAIDDTMHNIAYHSDGEIIISGTPISFVRMTNDERNKLDLIADTATALRLQVNAISTTALFENETIELIDSETVNWTITAPNQIAANFAFPTSAAHQHYYNRTPAHSNIVTPDYKNYKTTSSSTVFMSGSLRVTINGIRITEGTGVYVPPASGPSGSWTLTYFTPNAGAGTFVLNRALSSNDVIRIDFDTNFS